MPLLGTCPIKWVCWSGGSYVLRGFELKKITPWKITLPETNSSHPKTFMKLCSMLIFRGVLCNLRLQCSNQREQLDWRKTNTQTEHMEGNTVIWKALLWILVIHYQDTRKQAVAGTQARDSYPSHIIEKYWKCRLPFSVKQLHVKLPTGRTTWEEKVERWVGGEFFTGRSGR